MQGRHRARLSEIKDPEAAAERLLAHSRFVADSSTLILCSRSGFLETLRNKVALLVVSGVLIETGYGAEGFEELAGYDRTDTDTAVVQAARDLRLPVLSDDLTLLERVQRSGGEHYNAIMALTALLGRGAIGLDEFEELRMQLHRNCRYSLRVRRFADEVCWYMRKRIGV